MNIRSLTARAAPLLLGGLMTACGGASAPAQNGGASDGSGKDGGEDAEKGDAASNREASNLPGFELETLDGSSMSLDEHLGKKVILIDFWATYCDPCLTAMPHLNKLYEKYGKDGFVILGITIDGPASMARVRSEVRKAGITFPILLDPETEVLSLYNPKTSAPYSILIGRDGQVIKRKEGFTPTDVPVLEAAIVAALK